MSYISHFNINGLWGRKDIRWENIRPDVNVVIGINGVGKTTLLNLMYEYYTGGKISRKLAAGCDGNVIKYPLNYVRSLDEPSRRSGKGSLLDQRLNELVYVHPQGVSLFDYRMQMINFPDRRERVQDRFDKLFGLVDDLMSSTGKHIKINPETNKLVFSIGDSEIGLSELSSGEKQLLYMLVSVFLMDEKPAILLLDEPEISLHIAWQDKLIGVLRQLNPQCQLIITTHSPNIFADGWEENVTFVSEMES